MAERLLWLNDRDHLHDWDTYFGAPRPPEARRKAYNSYSIYLQAILDGEGIGLGWAHLLDDHFAAGNLRLASPTGSRPTAATTAASSSSPQQATGAGVRGLARRVGRSAGLLGGER